MKLKPIFFYTLITLIISCTTKDPNSTQKGEDILEDLEVETTEVVNLDLKYNDTIYVPIYSDIYVTSGNQTVLLAATLSIRNTSFSEKLFVSTIDYYNTQGELVRKYLDKPIVVNPMATVDYVIEKEDDTGGSGANFIITLSSDSYNVKPIIQAIMIGTEGNKGFAFTTEGYSIKK